MSERKTVLEQHKSDLEDILKKNNYATDVREVRRGIHTPEDMDERPCIAFWNEDSERDYERFGSNRTRRLSIVLWAYVDIKPGNYENLDNIAADVEKFLESSDNTYEDRTEVGIMRFYEGGALDPIGIVEIEYSIEYDYAVTSP